MEGISGRIRFSFYHKTHNKMFLHKYIRAKYSRIGTSVDQYNKKLREQEEGRLALNEGILECFQEELKFNMVMNKVLKSRKRLDKEGYFRKG